MTLDLSDLKTLNDHFSTRSYFEGYTPTQSDLVILSAIGNATLDKYPHVARWSKHISSFSKDEQSSFVGVKKSLAELGVSGKDEASPKTSADDNDDIELFGSDDDEEAEKARAERIKAYEEKKSKKPTIVAKSNVILDVKPWDDETDMVKMEEKVREIQMDGLVWGAAKLAPLAYGIEKLQIVCVIEDDKVSTDDLQEKIESISEYVQSVDIAAFQKV